MRMPTKEMIKAGQDISCHLYDAFVEKSISGEVDWSKYPEEYQDILKKYLKGEIISVTAIWLAMEGKKEEL